MNDLHILTIAVHSSLCLVECWHIKWWVAVAMVRAFLVVLNWSKITHILRSQPLSTIADWPIGQLVSVLWYSNGYSKLAGWFIIKFMWKQKQWLQHNLATFVALEWKFVGGGDRFKAKVFCFLHNFVVSVTWNASCISFCGFMTVGIGWWICWELVI